MKIILDVDAISEPLTGIGRYTLELAKRLPHHPDIEDIKFFSTGRWIENPENLISHNNGGGRLVNSSIRQKIPFKRVVRKLYNIYRNHTLKSQLKSCASDYLYHAPNFIVPRYKGKSIATIHDLSFIHYPEFHPKERVDYLKQELLRTIQDTSHILTDSNFIKQEIIQEFNLDEGHITTTLLGSDENFQPSDSKTLNRVLGKYHLQKDGFLLVVSTMEPRKNLYRLVQAYSQLDDNLKQQFPLVFAGGKGWLSDDLQQAITALEEQGVAKKLGYVDEADLPALYSGAAAFAYPSLYEGFGLPILEAMACGAAVLTSHVSSIPEVGGEAVLYSDPTDIESIKQGLTKIMQDSNLRAELKQKSLNQAKSFSWERCVNETVLAYKKALNTPHSTEDKI